MGNTKGMQRFARPVAELIGIAADDVVVRYGVLTLTLVFLAAAAYLFGPTALIGSLATLAVAYAIIFFIVYYWFLEEARKRRVMLRDEEPRPHDSENPDLRDEVLFACAGLFILTPLLLQTLNDSSLHYDVAPDQLGLKALLCTGASTFCTDNQRLFELPSWFLFTLQAFTKTVPVVEQLGEPGAGLTGIQPTAATPIYVDMTLRFMFGGFFLTIVVGLFQKVGRQIDYAVEALPLSPHLASGMGPIILSRLEKVLVENDADSACWRNTAVAVADIADRYPRARDEVCRLFEHHFMTTFKSVPVRTAETSLQERLLAASSALCAMRSEEGLALVQRRLSDTKERVITRQRLVEVVVDNLQSAAVALLQQIPKTSLSRRLTIQIESELARLQGIDLEDGDSGSEKDPDPPRQPDLPME